MPNQPLACEASEAVPSAPVPVNRNSAGAAPETGNKHPIIFFDGVCGLCNHTVDFVIARDHTRRFRFAPLQGETAQRLLHIVPGQSLDSMALIDDDGVNHRSDAVWRILAGLGGVWRLAGWLLRIIPRPIRNWGYNVIARHRYRWFGRKESCRLPTPEERALFLP